ncbi:MAG: hypothetical protein M1503_02675 [Thaumarchaeota archaeon]|nr:hypothetical protein [Nitrososphaerota archaeon]MCL5317156.1 hypothetical protein [Nitrososphaerota archaeon]
MSELPDKIVESNKYLADIERKYLGLKYRREAVKRWFNPATSVFFDAEESGKEVTLKQILGRPDFSSFQIFFVVRKTMESGEAAYELMDASFKNIGGKTITGFAHTFHANLEYMTRLGLQMRRLEYLEAIGYSYIP